MYTNKRWDALEPRTRRRLLPHYTIIPENKHGFTPGYYDCADIAGILRGLALKPNNADALVFIADMLE